jgi:hypothetical protein
MNRCRLVAALGPVLLTGYVLAAVPDNAILQRKTARNVDSHPGAVVVAQEATAITPNEQQLLNQMQADSTQLQADQAAEQAGTRSVNPSIKYIRASLNHLGAAASALQQSSGAYQGHRTAALQAMGEAHKYLMQCYRVDSHQE